MTIFLHIRKKLAILQLSDNNRRNHIYSVFCFCAEYTLKCLWPFPTARENPLPYGPVFSHAEKHAHKHFSVYSAQKQKTGFTWFRRLLADNCDKRRLVDRSMPNQFFYDPAVLFFRSGMLIEKNQYCSVIKKLVWHWTIHKSPYIAIIG